MDVMPMQYEMAIQFAFDDVQGKKFNRGKNNILKSLGFNLAERKEQCCKSWGGSVRVRAQFGQPSWGSGQFRVTQ